MDEPTLDIGWVPDGFTLADPPGLHIFESVARRVVLGPDQPPDPEEWRCWGRKALYIAPPTPQTSADRPYRCIHLTWYVLDSLGPTADTRLAGLDECAEYPSADGSGRAYVKDGDRHGLYIDDTYLVQLSFDEETASDDVRRMVTSIRIL